MSESINNKILYVWDLGETLFNEVWNKEKTGFSNYWEWLENKLGKKMTDISPSEEEVMYEIPYREGWYFNMDIMPGFKEVLERTEYNEVFTSGIPEQVDWRAEYLNPRVGFDVRKYFRKINSTFDYGETNIKTKEMLVDYLNKRYNEGFKIIVYADDKLKNCDAFKEAAEEIRNKYKDFNFRLYNIRNDNSGINFEDGYYNIGSLIDLLNNEEKLSKK